MTVSDAAQEIGPEIEAARVSDPDAFGRVIEPYRRELLVHAYRMLGSLEDAEDAVQDALVRSWSGRATFQRAISFRAWLYRITTNACLDAIAKRRLRSGAASLGVGPIPDGLIGDQAAGPEARYDLRESISLAFLTALQVLPPRQRAALLLRDVLGMRAAEVAALLDVSVPAVNGALLRARSTIASRYGPARASTSIVPVVADAPGPIRALLERYVRAWEAADVGGIVALLREDAALRMPPLPAAIGAAAIGEFLSTNIFLPGARARLTPIFANGRPAFIASRSLGADGAPRPIGVLVVGIDESLISRIDAFVDPRVLAVFAAAASSAG